MLAFRLSIHLIHMDTCLHLHTDTLMKRKIFLKNILTKKSSMQPCNPAVGGPAKSQLVHEVDALGGEIGKVADR